MSAQRRPFKLAIGVGIVLAIVGVGSYVVIEDAHFTTLIPAVLGVLFVGLGRLGADTDRERTAAYGIGLLALLGVAGSGRAFGDLAALVTGGDVDVTPALASQGLMIVLSVVLLAAVALYVADRR